MQELTPFPFINARPDPIFIFHFHFSSQMKIFRYPSALNSSFQNYFYDKDEVLGEFSVVRHESDGIDEFAKINLFTLFDTSFDATRDLGTGVQAWIFEPSLGEPDSRIARYYQGARTSNLIGRRSPKVTDRVVCKGNHLENTTIFWFEIHKTNSEGFKNNLDAIFGSSRIVVFTGTSLGNKPEEFAKGIFDAVFQRKTSITSTQAIPDILKIVKTIPNLSIGVGFGSKDFGGYFFDVFSKNR